MAPRPICRTGWIAFVAASSRTPTSARAWKRRGRRTWRTRRCARVTGSPCKITHTSSSPRLVWKLRQDYTSKMDVPRGSETILLVDADPETRKLAAFMLQKRGYKVLEARSSADALQTPESQIDLLLTEIHLSRTRGPDLAAKLSAIH